MKTIRTMEEMILLEKKIAILSASVEIEVNFDIDVALGEKDHVSDRMNFGKRGYGDNRILSNKDLVEFVSHFKDDIAEGLILGDLKNGVSFIIRSPKKGISMALIPLNPTINDDSGVRINYWKLIIKTVFPESETHELRVGNGQTIYTK